ncbi:haloacid dehalogenase [Nocardia nova]|uniref:Haloacid dehalogenase n=1 Tax=Nocardia nova TaxID=37330 RepID=A0A2S6AY90_9NOCA|nr:haloacid dehalogenase [Nocardia nova]
MAAIIASRPCTLLDFDGPVCSVFAGISARHVAQELGQAIGLPLPPTLGATSDPFEILQYAAEVSDAAAEAAEQALTALEVEAVALAVPAPHAHDVIRAAAHRPGGTVAIVSNNSIAAIDAYLTAHNLHDLVSGVYARTSATTPLKPSPYLLLSALSNLRLEAHGAIFIGDSTTDLIAAGAAGIPAIGYANKPGKAERFAQYSPAATIGDMSALLDAIRTQSVSP